MDNVGNKDILFSLEQLENALGKLKFALNKLLDPDHINRDATIQRFKVTIRTTKDLFLLDQVSEKRLLTWLNLALLNFFEQKEQHLNWARSLLFSKARTHVL